MDTAILEEPALLPSHFQTLFLNSIAVTLRCVPGSNQDIMFLSLLGSEPILGGYGLALSIPMHGSLNQYDYRSQSLLLNILACW
jgi:hypothetical protein